MSESKKDKIKNHLVEGPVSPEKVASVIAAHQSKTDIGAHAIFLGQVRADEIDGKAVSGIEYSAFPEMANKEIHRIKEAAFEKYDLTCAHIFHSTGLVKAGEMSFFAMVSSGHRPDSFAALREIVEAFKAEVPIWKKEVFEDNNHRWVNS